MDKPVHENVHVKYSILSSIRKKSTVMSSFSTVDMLVFHVIEIRKN